MRFLTVIAIAFGQIILTALLAAFVVDNPSPPMWATIPLSVLMAPYTVLALLPLIGQPQSGLGTLFQFLFNGAAWGLIVAGVEWVYRNR